jgi:hypothetical protein
MRGPLRESELVEAPPHRAEIGFSVGECCPLPASGARKAALLGDRSKCRSHNTSMALGTSKPTLRPNPNEWRPDGRIESIAYVALIDD